MVWDLTVSQSFDRYLKGDGCMRDTDHHIRHPRGHLGDRVSAKWTNGCAQRDDQFGRAQNTELGWSDPTFAYGSVLKVSRGSLQPNNLGEAGEEGRNYLLQLRLHHLLQLVMRISLGKTRK